MMQSLAFHVSVLRKDFSNYCGEKLGEMGLTPGLLYFVTYVARHPGCSPKELARELITHSPQEATDDRTALVIRLERRS